MVLLCWCFVVDCSQWFMSYGWSSEVTLKSLVPFCLNITLHWAVLLWLVWIKNLLTWALVHCLGLSMTARLLQMSDVEKQKLLCMFVPPCCRGQSEMVGKVIWTDIQWEAWLVLAVPRRDFFLQLAKRWLEKYSLTSLGLVLFWGGSKWHPASTITSFFSSYCHYRKGILKCQTTG